MMMPPVDFALPGLREGHDVGALGGGEAAAGAADEQLQGPVAFLDRDRMALAVVGREPVADAGGHRIVLAAGERKSEPGRVAPTSEIGGSAAVSSGY